MTSTRTFLTLTLFLLPACAGYDITLNDRVVYTPPSLFLNFKLLDSALENCIKQTITDQEIISPEALSTLNCSSAGIETLEGLSKFPAIKQLNLSRNVISNIQELADLSHLEVILLADNRVTSVQTLTQLKHLSRVSLLGNTQLDCATLATFASQHPTITIEAPLHC